MNRRGLTLNVKGRLLDFEEPKVMGIVNVTPDSFYAGSRLRSRREAEERVAALRSEGAGIVDLGGCSTRPGSEAPSAEEEYARLAVGLEAVRRVWPEAVVSVDTWRAGVARRCVEEWGADIVNDVSGGTLDPAMWETVAGLRVAYVLMHMRGTPATMQGMTGYGDVTADVLTELSGKVWRLRELGVNDIIIDPGFGFAKTPGQNLRLLDTLGEFCHLGLPVLAGLSRKSMVWKPLGATPEESLEGTVALGAIALDRGADIIRVHDVRPAVQTVRLLHLMSSTRRP